ncbi:hypothetical protein ACN47E_004581 [Coniothyrium glycines]
MSQHSVCSFCRENILRATGAWAYHHASFESLKNSAQRLCVFCRLLYSDVFAQWSTLERLCTPDILHSRALKLWLHGDVLHIKKLSFGHGSEDTSLYRWSARKLGRTRESKVVVVVTFRAVSREANSIGPNSKAEQPYNLPERVFHCFPEADLGELLNPAQLGPSTNPEAHDGIQIKAWIRKCSVEHKHCPKRAGAGSKYVPTRLLHVGGKRRGEPIRIVDTRASNVKGPYVTLSHCWGKSPEERKDKLTIETSERFMREGIPWEYLSKNFRQAVDVARFLEIDYIWIDSLCIIQDSMVDWAYESGLMHKVYRNSYCNIAAADAAESQGGLFRSRAPQDVLPAKLDCHASTTMFAKGSWRIVREDLWDHGLLQRPLYKRGWVFQERMLSPRILHFSKHQIFWDCTEMSACETIPSELPLPLDRLSSIDRHWRGRLQEGGTNEAIMLSAANDDLIDDFWRATVENYTGLDLTKQYDKRVAVWSIAKLVRDNLREAYVAGLWELALEEQLAWKVADCTTARKPDELATNPTWSWASINGKVLVQDRLQFQSREYRVTNHAGEPLTFNIDQGNKRPRLPREPSADQKEDIKIMGEELDLAHERRRKSSAATRQNSDVSYFELRHNSEAGPEGYKSGDNTPFAHQTLSPRSTGLHIQNRATHDKMTTSNVWFGNVLTMAKKTLGWIPQTSHSHLDDPQPIGVFNSQGVRTDRRKEQDVEPDLTDMGIAIRGYVNHGTLQHNPETGSWTLIPDIAGGPSQSAVVDAFPDITPKDEQQLTHFIILALSREIDYNDYTDSPGSLTSSKFWYVGHGIMLKPLGSKRCPCRCYVRTGSFNVRYMDQQMWSKLQNSQAVSPSIAADSPSDIILF